VQPPDAALSFTDATITVPEGFLYVECVGKAMEGGVTVEGTQWGFAFDKWCIPSASNPQVLEAYCHGIPDLQQLHMRATRPDEVKTGVALPVGRTENDVFAVHIGRGYGQSVLFIAERGQIFIDRLTRSGPRLLMEGRLVGLELKPVTGAAAACRVVSMGFEVR
jgi:hypothetical protein